MDRVINASLTTYRYGQWLQAWDPIDWARSLVEDSIVLGVTLRGQGLTYGTNLAGHLVPISGAVRSLSFYDTPYLNPSDLGETVRMRFPEGTQVEELAALTEDWLSADGITSRIESGRPVVIAPSPAVDAGTEGDDDLRSLRPANIPSRLGRVTTVSSPMARATRSTRDLAMTK